MTIVIDASFLLNFKGIGVELSILRLNKQCSTDRMEEIFIDRNLNYDFNFQQTVHLPREITVLPV